MGAGIFFIALAFLVVIWLAFFIFSRRNMPKIGLLLLGISPLLILYLFNHNLRIYSIDGFRHAGIVYQLLQGNIPPLDPLLSGQVMQYPWGWHCVAALITKLFNVTPFYSFAVINILSLCLTMVLVYKISRSVIEDEKANIFSVLISIFAITIYTQISTEARGVPLFEKFADSNGIPLGLVFFLLALFSLIKLFQNKNLWGNLLLFFTTLLGGGFLYPAFFPGIVASTVLLCLVFLFISRLANLTPDLKKLILLLGVLGLGIVCLMPYVFSITSGFGGQTQLFDLQRISVKIVRYVVVTLPLLIIIFLNKGYLGDNTDKTALTVLFTVVMATLCCYIFIGLPLGAESTYFILSTVVLGIVGGIAFHAMKQRLNKAVVLVIVLFFFVPLVLGMQEKLSFQNDDLPVLERYGEKESYLYSTRSEENELYEWIKSNTDKESTFIDVTLDIPVLAQRRLFIGMDRAAPMSSGPIGMKDIYAGEPGYRWKIDTFLRQMNCYDPSLIDIRQALVKRIYNPKAFITDTEIEELQNTFINVYVVDRTQALAGNMNREKFNQVFRSSQGQFLVHQLDFQKVSERLSPLGDGSAEMKGSGRGKHLDLTDMKIICWRPSLRIP